jgi:antirestriction protein ArdC
MAVGAKRGYDDPRWLTYRQAQENGWQVRQGEKGAQVEFWQFPNNVSKPDGDFKDQTDKSERASFIYRAYTVFNAKQIDGIPAHAPKVRQEWEVLQSAEAILRSSGARISYDQSDQAFYNRRTDTIHLPPRGAFKTATQFYGTALHELLHNAAPRIMPGDHGFGSRNRRIDAAMRHNQRDSRNASKVSSGRYRPDDQLLSYLKGL